MRKIKRRNLLCSGRPGWRAKYLFSIAVVFLAGVITACAGEPSFDQNLAVVDRFIAEEPQVLLASESLFDIEPVFEWTFQSAAELKSWELEELDVSWENDRLKLRPTGASPRLIRPLPQEMGEVHLIEVTLAGLTDMIRLSWAAEGEGFSRRRRQVFRIGPRKQGKRTTFTFDLASHPSWRREIAQLRLDPTTAENDQIRLISMKGFRRRLDPVRFAAAKQQGWKFDFDADVRNVLMAIPGEALEWKVLGTAGQHLRLSYGVEESIPEPVTFRVVMDGKEGQSKTLFEETLEPTKEGGRWHKAKIALDAATETSSNQELRLRLETETPRAVDLARGFSLWANPEILGQREKEAHPNVILISIDTLRADHLSAYGYPLKTSPNLDAWAQESAVLFQNTVAQAPWTLPSHASMFSGLDALNHGVNHTEDTTAGLEMLPEILRRAGYTTVAITGGGYLRPEFGFFQGFDTYRYWDVVGSDEQLARNTKELFDWLESDCCRPFFLFFHTYEVHYPYRRRQPYFSRLGGDDSANEARGEIVRRLGNWQSGARRAPEHLVVKQTGQPDIQPLTGAEKALVQRTYDSSIAYMDDHLGRILRRLEEMGLRGETLIVFTSDHGEALGEDDRSGHEYLEESNVLIPLIVEFPDGRGAGKVVEEQVRSIDIAPTILNYLGLDPPNRLDGVSLLPAVAGDTSTLPAEAWTYAASTNHGLGLRYQNRVKYSFNNTAWSELVGEEELLDLRQGMANAQRRPRGVARKKRLRSLAKAALESQHQGIRMRISNHGAGRLVGFLKGAWASVERVKVADPSCRCVHWLEGKRARFTLGPGQEVTLLFESVITGPLRLQGGLKLPEDPRETFKEEIPLQALQEGEPLVLAHTNTGWQLTSTTEEVAVGFTIWQVGEQESVAETPQVNRETEEQLRALGYLN